jgi:hypothetical protein
MDRGIGRAAVRVAEDDVVEIARNALDSMLGYHFGITGQTEGPA